MHEVYVLPVCVTCGHTLAVNTRMVNRLELFCATESCPHFVQSLWVDKSDLQRRA